MGWHIVDLVGVCATVVAAWSAAFALVKIKTERRVDFHLRLLVEIGDALGPGYADAPSAVSLRVDLLPSGLLPAASDWCTADPTKTGTHRRWEATGEPDGIGWAQWIKETVLAEVKAATIKMLDQR